MIFHKPIITALFAVFVLAACQPEVAKSTAIAKDNATTTAFRQLTKSSSWQLVDTIKMKFPAFHTQGLVKIGDIFYVSAVEIIEKTNTYAASDNLWDFSITRTPGKGRGWLFKFNREGTLLGKTELTLGDIFHPGGIDYDGRYIWVPVAEYRPNSASNIYRVDPETMEADLVFHVSDHIGGIVHNLDRDTFHGVSWGARRMYEWKIEQQKKGQGKIVSESWSPNPVHYIDYQDCHYHGINYMLCGGLQKFDTPAGRVAIGGIDLVDIADRYPVPVHLLPISQYWNIGDEMEAGGKTVGNAEMIVSNNPFWFELLVDQPTAEVGTNIARFYFLPNAGSESRLLVYDVKVPFLPTDVK